MSDGERRTENGERLSPREGLLALAAPFILVALLAILHGDALGEWWKADDPQIVLHAIRNTPGETLFSPADWRTLSIGFTPLVTLSFDADLALGGIRPIVFYTHQLAAIAAAVLLLFVLLEPLCGRWLALLTAAAVLAGPAMTLAAESLMIRHYVEGLALACAALIVWGVRGRTGAAGPYARSGAADPYLPRDGGAAVLYLLATLAKEVYAPLPLLFVADGLIRRVPLRRLAARLLPSAVAAVVYLAWRRWMLGSLGGYGGDLSLANLPAAAWHACRALFASAPPLILLGVATLTVAALVVLVVARPRDGAILIAALAIGVLLPFAGVAGLAEARYGFAPVVAAVALTGVALARLPRRWGIGAGGVLLILHAWGGAALDRSTDRTDALGRAEGMYVWERAAGSPALLAGSPGWYLRGLRDLRRISGGGDAPRYLLSIEGIVAGAAAPEEVVRIEGEPPAPRRLDPATILRVLEARSRLDDGAPLELRVSLRDLVVSWELGPEAGSSFVWLTVPEYDEYRIPPTGSLRIPAPTGEQGFRVMREIPGDRWTLSPVLDLPKEGTTIAWRRGDAGA